MNDRRSGDNHWLTRPETIRWLWIGFGVILALTVIAQFAVKMKSSFGVDGSFGFGAWFGFVACVAMVLVAKALGWVLKRPEGYYGDDEPPKPVEDRGDA